MVLDALVGYGEAVEEPFIPRFAADLSPCACRGEQHPKVDVQCIPVHQRLVVEKVNRYLTLWCYARVCALCGTEWVTQTALVGTGDVVMQTDPGRRILAWWYSGAA